MKRIALLTALVVLAALSTPVHTKEPAEKISVIVANDPVNPVPIDGSVMVTNTPDVNVVNTPTFQAEQMGEWDVSIINGLANPIPVTVVDQATGQDIVNRGAYGMEPDTTVDRFVVPLGKVFILTDLSVSPQLGGSPTPTSRIGFYITDRDSDIIIREVFFGSAIHRAFTTGYVFRNSVRVTNEAASDESIIVAFTGLLIDE